MALLPKRLVCLVALVALTPVPAALARPPVISPSPVTTDADPDGLRRGTRFEIPSAGAVVSVVESSKVVDALAHATPRSLHLAVMPVPDDAGGGGTVSAGGGGASAGGSVIVGGAVGAGGSAGGGEIVTLTLSGLVPETSYYLYLDSFRNLQVILSDTDGRYAFDLDLSAKRLVILQPNPSTIHLKADGTGCPFIGTFDAATKTCTLKRDVFQAIEIDDDGVTLDGAGFTIDGSSPLFGSSGVMVSGRSSVTVRNVVIDGAPIGVVATQSRDCVFENLTILNATGGLLETFEDISTDTGRNVFRDSTVGIVCDPADVPCGFGVLTLLDNATTIEGNDFTGAKFGVSAVLSASPAISRNTMTGCATGVSLLGVLAPASVVENTVTGAETGLVVATALGCEVRGNIIDGAATEGVRLGSYQCTMSDNTISNGALGLDLTGATNTIVHNRFLNNTQQALLGPNAPGNLLSQASRIGGNHWSDFDEQAEGCLDGNADGYCDAAYPVGDATSDLLPWSADSGWRDIIPPVTTITLEGTLGDDGWYVSPVNVVLSALDEPGGTGVLRSECGSDPGSLSLSEESVGLTSDGAQALYCRSIDRAGNGETPQRLEVHIDTAPPAIEASIDPAPNAAGWNKDPVTVKFDCSDATSGVASCSDPAHLDGEGADQEVTGSARDVAGNHTDRPVSVDIDLTAPGIEFAGGCGETALYKGALTTGVTVTDALSGIGSQSVPDGPASLPTGDVGARSFTVEATDVAGNGASAACDYQVIYDFLGAGGFKQPVDNPPVLNLAKAGSTIPVKWQIPDGADGFLSSLSVVLGIQAQQVSCSALDTSIADPIETTSASAAGLRFDPVEQQYIFNWKTTLAQTGKCFVLLLRLNDGQTYSANFQFRR
jgi:parallel beta-helix repeat protein